MISRKRFNTLCEEWHRDTCFHSNPDVGLNHPAYKEIVAQGKKILPWVFDRILWDDRTHWITFAHAITGVVPFPDYARGMVPLMKAYWIVWGCENGYIDPEKTNSDWCLTNSQLNWERLHGRPDATRELWNKRDEPD